MAEVHLDVAIFGGGIAGLWTLARLRQNNYRVALFEKSTLGGGQSIAAQGIIHGGTKYALTGKLTGSAQSIRQMPAIWRSCLQGQGELNLSTTQIMSRHQYLWTSPSLASSITGFFASQAMQSRMQSLSRAMFVPPFNHEQFRGKLYRLNEPVLNTATLIDSIARPYLTHCYQLEKTEFAETGDCWAIKLPHGQKIHARHLLLTAGQGNAELLKQLGQTQPKMQQRPLHMLMVKGQLPPLYAHYLNVGALPELTITSDQSSNGETIWYLGGKVAEEGVKRSTREQIAAGKQVLTNALPWLDFNQTQWACLRIDRAEPATANKQRPDDSFVQMQNQIITAWPTKLALAPRTASQVLACLPPPDKNLTERAIELPQPAFAQQPWYGEIAWY